MIVEEKLKEYILDRYSSIREFSASIGVSNSTINSILTRGVGNSSVANVIKICDALHISADALSQGKIIPSKTYEDIDPKTLEITEILDVLKAHLLHYDGLTFEGKPASKEIRKTIVHAITVGEEMAKKE